MLGGTGADTLRGQAGDDVLDGGAGNEAVNARFVSSKSALRPEACARSPARATNGMAAGRQGVSTLRLNIGQQHGEARPL